MLNPEARPFQCRKLNLPSSYATPPPLQSSQLLLRPPFCPYFPSQHHRPPFCPYFPSQQQPWAGGYFVYYSAQSQQLPSLPLLPCHWTTNTIATIDMDIKSRIEDLEAPMEVRQDYKEIDDGVKRMDVPSRWKGMSRSYFNSRSRGKNSVSMWRPKAKTMEGLSGVASSSFNLNGFEQKLCDHTTVMMKNLPNKFSRKKLLDLLDQHCIEENEKARLGLDPCLSEYDFVYLPMDFMTRCNLGYAFVNFTSAIAASRLYKSFHQYKWNVYDTKKICEISYAKIQRKEALVEHFQKTYFTCDTDEFLPVQFSPPRNGSTSRPPPSIVGSLVRRRRLPS